MISDLDHLWHRLEGEGSSEGGWIRLRVPGLPEFPLYAARNLSTGLDGLILEIPTQSVDPSVLTG
ncbi:MAG: hypothetical protein RLN75_03525, partial [Longimicrobiales bacterium]